MIQLLLDITTSWKHKPLWYSLFWISLYPGNTRNYDTASSGNHYILETQETMIQLLLDIITSCKHKPLWYGLFWISLNPVYTSQNDTAFLHNTISCKHKPLWYGLFWISYLGNTSHYDTAFPWYHSILETQATMIQTFLDITTSSQHKPLWYSFFWILEYHVNTSHYSIASSGYQNIL